MKKLTVDGITFETTKEAKAAERELEAIEKIRGRMDVTNPIYAKVLHEKLIEKEMLHTKVGDKFLTELQGYYAPEAAKETADAGETVSGAETTEAPEAQSSADAPELSDAEANRDRDEVDIPYLSEVPREEGTEVPEDRINRSEGEAEPAVPEASAEPVAFEASEAEMPEERGERTDYADDIRFSLDFDEPSMEDAQKEPPTVESQEEQSGKAAVGSDTARLEGIMSGAIFDEKDLVPIGESSEAAELDALMAEYGLMDDAEPESAGEAEPEEDEEVGAAELDALMAEYGLTDDAEPKSGGPLDAKEDGKTDTAEPDPDVEEKLEIDMPEQDTGVQEFGEAAAEPEEDEEISMAELDTLMEEQSQPETAEAPLGLDVNIENVNIENDEEVPGTEEDRFQLDLDDEYLFGDEPDDATLLAQARTLKKELHQEDLSEVFSDGEEQPAGRKRFSLYGVLLLSIILNVVLIVSMVIMVRVFKDSDNRNILNYERILEQEYQTEQTATPTDAE